MHEWYDNCAYNDYHEDNPLLFDTLEEAIGAFDNIVIDDDDEQASIWSIIDTRWGEKLGKELYRKFASYDDDGNVACNEDGSYLVETWKVIDGDWVQIDDQ